MLAARAPGYKRCGGSAAPQRAGTPPPITRSCRQGLLRGKSWRARERPCRMGAARSSAVKCNELRGSGCKHKPSRKNNESDHSASSSTRLLLCKVLARRAVHVHVPSTPGFDVAHALRSSPSSHKPFQIRFLSYTYIQRIRALLVPLVPFLVGKNQVCRSCNLWGCLFRKPALCIAIPGASNHDAFGRCTKDIITRLVRASQWLTLVPAASQLC